MLIIGSAVLGVEVLGIRSSKAIRSRILQYCVKDQRMVYSTPYKFAPLGVIFSPYSRNFQLILYFLSGHGQILDRCICFMPAVYQVFTEIP